MVFEMIGTAENLLKTMSLKNAFSHYLKWFETAKKNENKHGKLFIVKVIETIWNCREKIENNDGKWCIL